MDKKTASKRYDGLGHISKEFKEQLEKEKPEHQALEKLFNELYIYATRDHLTGVLNRRILDELLGKEMERAIRHKLPLSVIILDIDEFKHYNDTYGHFQGDLALKTVTNVIQKATRHEDFVARYGGEEFIIVLPDTNLERAKEIAERMRKKIAETKIRATKKNLPPHFEKITVSMGLALLEKKGMEDMLHRADEALYRAKREGRNKVVVSKE